MTEQEFFEKTGYLCPEDDNFNFEEMHEAFVKRGISVDEYCADWKESYDFFGFADGIEPVIDDSPCVSDPYEDWINTPNDVLAQVGIMGHRL